MRNDVQDFIKQLSPSVIRSILAEISPYISRTDEDEGQHQLVSALTCEETIAKLWAHLSQYEQEVLRYFIYQVHDDFLSYRQIEQGLKGIKPTSFRLGLTALRRKGFIYTVRRQWGEVAYILPTDVAHQLYRLLLKAENMDDLEPCWAYVHKEQEEYVPIYIDLFLLLDQLRAEKDYAVPLTRRGSIHKRYIRAWQEIWPNRERKLANLSLTYDNRDIYNRHTALILDFFTKKQIISWYAEHLVLNLEEAQQWLQYSRAEMREHFLAYWSRIYVPSSPWLRRYQLDMLAVEHGDWMYLLSLVEQWEEEYPLPNVSELKQILKKDMLDPLLGMGLIELGTTDAGEVVWRWKVEGEEKGTIWVQPTLEIYCPSMLSFSILWELTKLLEIEKWETLLVMQLSKARVLFSMEKGENLKECLHRLESKLACTFPTAFIDQLNMWSKTKAQARFSQKTVIEIADEALAKAWVKWPELINLDISEITPGIFLIDLEKEDEVKGLFAKQGIQVQEVSVETEKKELETRYSLINSPFDDEHELRVESVFPELTEAIPAWNTLPDLWKKQLNPYHDQTKRSMIKQAIEHELTLRVETNGGELMEILPTNVQVEDGHWVCYDMQNNRYNLELMCRLQLLFPVPSNSC